MSNGYRPTFFTRARALYFALLLYHCKLISTTRICKNNVSPKNLGGVMEEELGRDWAANMLLSWGKGDTHTYTLQPGSESLDPGEVHSQYQSAIGQDPRSEMATPSLWGYKHPKSGFSSAFLIEYTEKNTTRQYRPQTENIIVTLALHHEPNPAPSKSASIC